MFVEGQLDVPSVGDGVGVVILVLFVVIYHDWWSEGRRVDGKSDLDWAEELVGFRLFVCFRLEGLVKGRPNLAYFRLVT